MHNRGDRRETGYSFERLLEGTRAAEAYRRGGLMRVAFEDERMRIRTRCRDTEQLICTFKPFVSGTSLFVSALATRPVDTEAVFEVSLVDGTVVMRGRGVIRQIWNHTDNPFRRAGTLVAIRTLTRSSKGVYDRIVGRPSVPDPTSIPIPPKPPAAPTPDTAFVTDSGTWLGAPEGRRPGVWTEETDAFLEMLRALPPREHIDGVAARRTTNTVPVKVTIPPRGARGEDAKPRIETAPLVSAAVPRPVTQDRCSKVTVVENRPEAAPEAMPEDVSAATTEPLHLPDPEFVPTERNPRLTTADESGEHAAPRTPALPPPSATPLPAVPEPYEAYETSIPSLRPTRRAIWWPLAALIFAAAAAVLFYTRPESTPVTAPAGAHAATFDLKVMRRPTTDADHMTFDVVVTPPCAVERK